MRRAALSIFVLLLLAACASPPDATERLRAACRAGDRASCEALERGAVEPAVTEAAEPEVVPARREVRRSTTVGIGGSTNSGVGVGVGIGFGL